MGCCLCHPLAEVEQDPTVSFHVTVGDIAIVRGIVSTSIKGCFNGIMYVKDDVLYYETQCGSNLCCKCCRHSFPVSQIQNVEVVHNQAMLYQTNQAIFLNPGLKITVRQVTGFNTVILVALPDAVDFAQQLLRARDSLSIQTGSFS